ncbi:DUF3817 domain-containing protein [Microbacterium dextranolyticum]|uniref:DUF3817 domain-containing protein n=1 Tax=Microbacterium dextranolyticum TaxID=36806 RepID=A0A9W6HP33_9MICO|nr:DUF3817 domain-containing protein [Microbacterium dextranolyticum]MBM7462579.1 integral membrane protein [Microbacterium dextranolyticum]GLJ96319.1 hypothetical protein GCM10017591_23820 [Microbacterium dextranolyticum]
MSPSRSADAAPTRSRTRSPAALAPMGKVFAVAAVLEAVTWVGLLRGMFLKYVTRSTERGVTIFGPLHGYMFVIYIAVAVVAAVVLRWSWWVAAIALLAAIPPLATIPLEIIFRRRGLLSRRTREPRPHAQPPVERDCAPLTKEGHS